MHFLFTKVGCTEIPSYLSIGDSDGSMPFHLACGSGNLDAVESFTEAVISSSDPLLLANTNNNGYNVFHFAATNGSLPIIEHLIEVIPVLSAIVPINITGLLEAKTVEDYSPLHLSCVNGHVEVVKSLATLCPSTISMVTIMVED